MSFMTVIFLWNIEVKPTTLELIRNFKFFELLAKKKFFLNLIFRLISFMLSDKVHRLILLLMSNLGFGRSSDYFSNVFSKWNLILQTHASSTSLA